MMTNEYVSYKFETGSYTRLGSSYIRCGCFIGAGTNYYREKKNYRSETTSRHLGFGRNWISYWSRFLYEGALLVAISVWGVISMFQPLKKYLQSFYKIIELYIVVKSTEAYNRVFLL